MKSAKQVHQAPRDDEGFGKGRQDLLADMREAGRDHNALAAQLLSMGITESGDGVTDREILGGVL